MKVQNSVENTRPRWLPRRPHWLSRGLVIVAVVLTAALPMGVAAGHRFTDVPGTNPFHAAIDAIARAGITAGCGDGTTYCPDESVRRDAMAAFMHRGFGRVAVKRADDIRIPDGSSVDSQAVTIDVGGTGAGSRQYVKVDATFTLDPTDNCSPNAPCLIGFHIVDNHGRRSEKFDSHAVDGAKRTVALSAVFEETPGIHSYHLKVEFLGVAQAVGAELHPIYLTATTYPFLEGGTGPGSSDDVIR